MDNNQRLKIGSAIQELTAAIEYDEIKVQSTFNEDGSFKVVASKMDRTVVLAHGISLHDDKPYTSATVDILFRDNSMNPTEYFIVMAEGEPDDYPWNVQEGQRLMMAFFGGHFEKRTIRKLFFFKSEDLWFTAEGLTYRDATA